MRGDIVPPKRPALPPAARQLPPVEPQLGSDVQPPQNVAPSMAAEQAPQDYAEGAKQHTELPPAAPAQGSNDETSRQNERSKRHPLHHFATSKHALIIVAVFIALVVALVIAATAWYTTQLAAVKPSSEEFVKVTIEPGSGPADIAKNLKQHQLIRSESAFALYVRLTRTSGLLQTGSYRLSKGYDVKTIVSHLTSGKTDTFSLTFLPGATLQKHRQVLIDAGYSAESVDAAFAKTYDHPVLFAGKPAGSDLEGYIYGETYNFEANATPEDILNRIFEQFESVVQQQNLTQLYQQRGFNLYQGLTLASVIQREVATPSDAAQVAQVFELRLKSDMPLGSDVTYQYIADKTGQTRSVDIDSPYNTRRYKGLPPGPISSPGLEALKAVGSPAPGDYVYFLSGDDDKTYFARTNEEHEKNIRDHCQKKCQII